MAKLEEFPSQAQAPGKENVTFLNTSVIVVTGSNYNIVIVNFLIIMRKNSSC